MERSTITAESGAEHHYGPKSEQYLHPGCYDLSQPEPPTYDEAFQATEALREDLDVTYEDFKTILSMEKSPTCHNLYLLPSTPDNDSIGIFPACVSLLRVYCNAEGNGILDHASGFLCLRVMSLAVQLAMLAHNKLGESKWFKPFYLETASLPEGQSTYLTLSDHIKRLFDWSKELDKKERDLTLIGVCYNSETKKAVCLPHCGKCSIPDAEFVVEKLWSGRDKFLLTSRWATNLFPRLGVMFDMIRALFAAPHVRATIPMSTWTIWVHLAHLGLNTCNFPRAWRKFQGQGSNEITFKVGFARGCI